MAAPAAVPSQAAVTAGWRGCRVAGRGVGREGRGGVLRSWQNPGGVTGSCVGVVSWGRTLGSWVGREVRFVGFWQSALLGVAAPRGVLALQSLVGWPGQWHRAPAPSLLPAPPRKAGLLNGGLGPRSTGP